MKRITNLLLLLGGLFTCLSIFSGCKDAIDIAKKNPEQAPLHKIELKLKADLVKKFDSNTSKAFQIDDQTGDINWISDTWGNDEDNKPFLAIVVTDDNNRRVSLKEIDRREYDYYPGSKNKPGYISINTYIEFRNKTDKIKLYLYRKYDGKTRNSEIFGGAIQFNGSPVLVGKDRFGHNIFEELYSIANDEPCFIKPDEHTYFNFIFHTEMSVSDYFSNRRSTFTLRPLGTLLRATFKPGPDAGPVVYKSSGYKLIQEESKAFTIWKGDVPLDNYFENKETYSSTEETPLHFYDTFQFHQSSAGPNIYHFILKETTIKVKKGEESAPYFMYVLPTNSDGFILNIVNTDINKLIYRHDTGDKNFSEYNGKILPISLYARGEIESTVEYNPLRYFAEENYKDSKHPDGLWSKQEFLGGPSTPLPKGWSIPTINDWYAIIPNFRISQEGGHRFEVYNEFPNGYPGTDVLEQIQGGPIMIGKGMIIATRSFYKTVEEPKGSGHWITYAIKFAYGDQISKPDGTGNSLSLIPNGGDNHYRSVWRYSIEYNTQIGFYLQVYCYPLPLGVRIDWSNTKIMWGDKPKANPTEDNMNEQYFKDRLDEGALVRIFPAKINHPDAALGLYFSFTPDFDSMNSRTEYGRMYWSYNMGFAGYFPSALDILTAFDDDMAGDLSEMTNHTQNKFLIRLIRDRNTY